MKNVVLCSMMALFCLFLSSCVGNVERPSAPIFREYYSRIALQVSEKASTQGEALKFSFSANDAPLGVLLRQIADKTNISVIAHSSLENSKVSIEVKNSPVSEVLASIARSLDRRLTRIGAIYFLGPVEPEDRGSLVRRIRRLSGEELQKIVTLFQSEHGRSHVSDDGLVVVADRVEVLERISQTFDQVESAQTASWVIQLAVVALGDRTKTTLGLSTDLTAKFAANLASPATAAAATDASLAFTALLQSVHDSTDSRIVAEPLIVLRDGAESLIRRGEDLRIAKKTTSPYGTVEITGYEVIPTGLSIKTTIRDDTSERASVKLDVTLSSVSGFTEGAPNVTTQQLTSQTSLISGGVYLLGAIEGQQLSRSLTGNFLPLLYGRDNSTYTLQIWAKAYRIGGPLSNGAQKVATGESSRLNVESPDASSLDKLFQPSNSTPPVKLPVAP